MKMGLQCMTVVFKNELNLLMKRVFKFIDFPLNYFRNNVKQKWIVYNGIRSYLFRDHWKDSNVNFVIHTSRLQNVLRIEI